MKIVFLVRGNETKTAFASVSLPDGIGRKIGTYGTDDGDLHFVDFSVDGDTLTNARKLATLRDELPLGEDIRMLRDEASAKFCELLYPHFCRFEKGLREAITIATCAEQGNFDDKHVLELEERLSLEALYNLLFVDRKFVKNVQSLTKGNFTREELEAGLGDLDEKIPWDVLFGPDDMPTIRKNRIEIKDRRNDVMHYHKITEEVFDKTRSLVKTANNEIDLYLNRVRGDISYPRAKAGDARVAAQMINQSYADMLEGIQSSLDYSGIAALNDSFSSISRAVAESADLSAMTNFARLTSNMGSFNLSQAAQQAVSQQTVGLSTGVTKALSSLKINMPKIDVNMESTIQQALEPLRASQNAMAAAASFTNSLSETVNRYQSLLPRDSFDKLKLAANASMDFSAGLGMGAALSQAMRVNRPGSSDDPNASEPHYGDAD